MMKRTAIALLMLFVVGISLFTALAEMNLFAEMVQMQADRLYRITHADPLDQPTLIQ